jgi:hypothetical protein
MQTTLTKQQFVKQLTQLLQENYPVTEDFIEKELTNQLNGDKPTGIMGIVIAENLKKVKVID